MMKKEYVKPTALVESFELDMPVAAPSSGTEEYYQLVTTFEELTEGDNGIDFFEGDEGKRTEADFQAFLAFYNYDNSTSGYCYHGFNKPPLS